MQRAPITHFEARLEDGRPLWLERRPLRECVSTLARIPSPHAIPVDDPDVGSADPGRGLGWEASAVEEGGGVPMGVGILVRESDPDAATAIMVLAEGPQRAVVGELLVGTLQLSALDLGIPRLRVRVAPDDPLLCALIARFEARLCETTPRFTLLELSRTTSGRTLVSSGTWPQLPPDSLPAA